MTAQLNGTVSDGYEAVADAFERTIVDERQGAAVAIRVDGELVVDLWAGIADARTGRPWQRDTVAPFFSCGKGLMAILVQQLVQEGRLDLTTRVSDYWPEFAAAGKQDIPVAWLLRHRAGLPAIEADLTLDDVLAREPLIRALELQHPLWAPGDTHAYHPVTFGWLVGEVIRRITGMGVGEYFRKQIGDPLHADAWLGLPASEEGRVAYMTRLAPPADAPDLASWRARSMTQGSALPVDIIDGERGFNDPRVHQADMPAANGIGSARALADIWSATVVETEGVRLMTDAAVAESTRVRSEGRQFEGDDSPQPRFGEGFMLNSPGFRDLLTAASFGHDGAGGELGFADPIKRVGFGYVSSVMQGHEESDELVATLRQVLGA